MRQHPASMGLILGLVHRCPCGSTGCAATGRTTLGEMARTRVLVRFQDGGYVAPNWPR